LYLNHEISPRIAGIIALTFNDLLILRYIVPSLPLDIIRDLLHELKPHRLSSTHSTCEAIDFEKITVILSKVKEPSPLLYDFLACSGVKK
jgi:hypothetical protein